MRKGMPYLSLLLLGCIGSIAGAQTVYGPGGLFIHPTAFTPQRGAVGMNVSYFTQKIGSAQTEWIPVSLTYAPQNRLELGALYVNRLAKSQHRDSGGAFAKFQFVEPKERRPAVAFTASYIGGDIQLSSVSGVASYGFRNGNREALIAHAGVQWARRADISVTKDDVSGFAGLELPVGRGFRLIAEGGTRFSFDRNSTSAIGVMWDNGGRFKLGIGYINAGRSDDNRFFVGAGYALGGAR